MDEIRPLPMFRCEQIERSKLAKEWREWKGSLEFYFDAYQITDQKIMHSKMLHFGGPQLQNIFKSLEGTDDFPLIMLEKRCYDVAVNRLDTYFKPRSQDVLERHKLRNMKQGRKEHFSHYVLRLRQQLIGCGFEKYQREVRNVLEEIMLIDVIVEGCNSPELQRKILEKDLTLAEIELLGPSFESVYLQEKDLNDGMSSDAGGQTEVCKIKMGKTRAERQQGRIVKRFATAPHNAFKSGSEILCYACGQHGHISKASMCPARGQQCQRCRKTGHFEKLCRKRPFDPTTSSFPEKMQAVQDVDTKTQSNIKKAVPTKAEKKFYYTL